MKLIIYNKDKYDKSFIYNYLPGIINEYFIKSFNTDRLKLINNEFNINSLNIIKYALKHLSIHEQANAYIIEINKNLKYKENNVDSVVNLITYGNRTCKGYPIIYDIFKLIAEDIDRIYEEWDRWR